MADSGRCFAVTQVVVERVGAFAAVYGVVAKAAVDNAAVGIRAGTEAVVARHAQDRVVALAAVHQVIAAAGEDGVVAGLAVDRVVVRVVVRVAGRSPAEDGVGVGRAVDVIGVRGAEDGRHCWNSCRTKEARSGTPRSAAGRSNGMRMGS